MKLLFYKQIEFPLSKNAWDHVIPQTIENYFHKAGFLSENLENMGNEEIKQMVTINNWDDVRQSVNILFDDYVNTKNDLEVCGHLSDDRFIHFVISKMYSIIGRKRETRMY